MSPCDLGEEEEWKLEGRKGMNEDGRVERLFRCKTRKGSINHQPNCKSCSPPIQMSLPLCHFRFLSSLSILLPQPLLHSCSKCISFQSIHLIVRFFLRKKGFLFQEQQIHQSEVFWLEELSPIEWFFGSVELKKMKQVEGRRRRRRRGKQRS